MNVKQNLALIHMTAILGWAFVEDATVPSKVVTEWYISYSADQVATEMRAGWRTQSDSETSHESPSHRLPNF